MSNPTHVANGTEVSQYYHHGKYYIAPLANPTDAAAAGIDHNVFDTEDVAMDKLRSLLEAGDLTGDWVVEQYRAPS